MGWYEFDQHAKTPAPQLVSEDKRVRLYDAHGRLLVRDNRVGFRPPQAAPGGAAFEPDRQRVQQQGEETRTQRRRDVEEPL
jgi:hypothetical protein